MKINISVVIPTRNRQCELKAAVKSVFEQSRPPEEIIVVDDGSCPPVSEDIFEGCPQGTQTRLFRRERSLGANNSRNLAIRQASGDWIAFLDDDDRFKQGKIEAVADAIANNPDADLFYHPAEIRMVKENVVYRTKPEKFDKNKDIFRALLIKNLVGGSSMVTARREALIEAGLFDVYMPALQDYELWLRLAKSGCRFCFIDSPLTTYCCHTDNSSISKPIDTTQKALEIIEKKYGNDYAGLAPGEIAAYNEWKKHRMVHKAILNGQVLIAFKEQMKIFAAHPHPRHLLGGVAILLGRKLTFLLRAKLN
ncbi:MAG: glycosyltransferase family 2 protein [Desulfosalsimonas sp.]